VGAGGGEISGLILKWIAGWVKKIYIHKNFRVIELGIVGGNQEFLYVDFY
jgi:hypothetical protein